MCLLIKRGGKIQSSIVSQKTVQSGKESKGKLRQGPALEYCPQVESPGSAP